MRHVRQCLLVAIVCAAATANAQTERLETLARVWAAVKFTHPAMLTRNVDWDGALVRAIPHVRAATNDAELAAAIDGMLKELGDPATRVNPAAPPKTTADVPLTRNDGDVLVVNLGPAIDRDGYAVIQDDRKISAEIAKADFLVIDTTTSNPDTADTIASFIGGAALWTNEPLTAVPTWTTVYSGYAPQRGWSSGDYYAGLLLKSGSAIPVAKHAPKRLAFVTDGRIPLSPAIVALWRAGKAAIVSSAPISTAAALKHVAIGGGYDAQIRSGEFAVASFDADVVSPSPVEAAVQFVRGTTPLRKRDATVLPVPATHNLVESDYREMAAPDLEHRLLACFRIWSTIAYFYPYKPLIGDWDAVLREFIPRFEQADGDVAYVKAVLEMTAHVEDGHTGRDGHPSMAKVLPVAFVPIGIRRIEGQPVVVEKLDPAVPLAVGDVIVSVDGEPFETRVHELWKYVTGATEAARDARVMNIALHGATSSIAHLGTRGADGVVRQVDVPRLTSLPPQPDKGPGWRMLDGNIGYADLTRLKVSEVDPMFDALMSAKAIILDMRGYPLGTAWEIAPRINTWHATVGARFSRPQFSGTDTDDTTRPTFAFEQLLPVRNKPVYGGKIVVLIDTRAISQAEHSCLFFEQAAGATFIGTPTAGANGDVTNYVLPGGFVVYFTGHEVRHADGRQLQRVGIQPDIVVAPTIAGLRAGKDEVLDRAVAFVNSAGAASPLSAFNAALDHATRTMDNAATMALWADDGVSLLPAHAPIEGKKAIAAFIDSVTSSMPAAHMETFEMQCHDEQVSGDWASEWCDEHQVVRFADGRAPFDGRGKMLLILHKNAAGQWQLKEEMWNQGTK